MALAVVTVAIAASGGLLAYRYSQIDRVALPDDALVREDRGEPENFLLVGSDSRAFVEVDQEAESYGTAAEVGAPKADTILVARTFPDDNRVALVSFPRDLWVPIAGTDRNDRINAAFEGGAAQLIATLDEAFGIPIHHVVQIDFRGFKGLVNAVGGVDVYFPSPVRDWDPEKQLSPTGLVIDQAGCVRLDGDMALAYVRSRNYERLVDGRWQRDPTGDLNRIARQQDFLRRTLRQALSRGFSDPRRLNSVAASAVGFVEIDDNLGAGDIIRFGRRFQSLTAESLETYSLPTRPDVTEGGAQVLIVQEEAAQPVLDVFRGVTDRPAVLLPGSVRLRVLDSAGARNSVAGAAFRLAAAGYVVTDTGDSAEQSRETVIRYAAGQRLQAELVSTSLVGPAVLAEDPALVGVDVVLLLGRDWQGVKETAGAPTTTAPPAGTPPTTAGDQVPASAEC